MTLIDTRKTLILPIVLMVMMVGSSAAFWNATLKFKGNITTDDLKPELSLPPGQGDNEVTKDIGHVKGEIYGPFPNTIVITIDHAYPSYAAWVAVGVHNAGSVPGIIHISWDAPPELEIWMSQYAGNPWPVEGYQLDYCHEIFFYVNVHVLENDAAVPPIKPLQDHTYTFTVTITFVQYNMPP